MKNLNNIVFKMSNIDNNIGNLGNLYSSSFSKNVSNNITELKESKNPYLFKLQTKEGYTFKILVELIKKYIKDGCFIINKSGIKLNGIDTKTKRGTKLICVTLDALKISKFKVENNLCIGINMVHFYTTIKQIKKKDQIILFIKKDEPLKLYINIIQTGEDEKKGVVGSVNITNVQPFQSEIPVGYENPVISPRTEFQKIKNLGKTYKIINITRKKKSLELFCDREDIYSKKVILGDTEEDDYDDDEKDEEQEYKNTYDYENIVDIVKLANTSNNILIYTHQDLPICFKMDAGSLGTVELYIK